MSGMSSSLGESRVVVLNIPDDLEKAFPIVHELRTHLDLDEFKRLVSLAHAADGYRLVAREENRKTMAVMGYRILHDLVHGSHLYIDDLVTTRDARSQGHGAELLRWAEAEARRLGLSGLRLSTGIDNEAARRFYEREGWQLKSVVYKKTVPKH